MCPINKKKPDYPFNPIDWNEVLGGRKAKIIACIVVILYFLIPIPSAWQGGEFGIKYLGYTLFPVFSAVYIVIEYFREHFGLPIEDFGAWKLIFAWCSLIGIVVLKILSL